MRQFLRSLLASRDRDRSAVRRINAMRQEFARLDDDRLRTSAAVICASVTKPSRSAPFSIFTAVGFHNVKALTGPADQCRHDAQ